MARRNWSPGPNLAADQLLRDSTMKAVKLFKLIAIIIVTGESFPPRR